VRPSRADTAYRHFSSQEALLAEAGIEPLMAEIDDAVESAQTIRRSGRSHRCSVRADGTAPAASRSAAARHAKSAFFPLFEKLINVVHEGTPHAKTCFNTNPADTAEAVQRWI